MQAKGHLRSGATEDFLVQSRLWNIEGDLVERNRGNHDPNKVVTIEISLAQLARLADILRHARGENWFDPDGGFGSRPVDWSSYYARLDAERVIAADRASRYPQKLD